MDISEEVAQNTLVTCLNYMTAPPVCKMCCIKFFEPYHACFVTAREINNK